MNSYSDKQINKSITNDSIVLPVDIHEVVSYNIDYVTGEIYTNTKFEGRKVFVEDEEANKINYDKLVAAMPNFENYKNSNYFSTNTSISNVFNFDNYSRVQDESSSSINLRKSPFYMETVLDQQSTVLKEEEGRLFNYQISENKFNNVYWVDKTLLGEVKDPTEYYNFEELINSAYLEEYDFNYNVILIEIEDNKYVLTGYYKDVLDEEEFIEKQETFKEIGYDESVLNNSSIKLTITILEDELSLETILTIPVNINGINTVETISKVRISSKEFPIIDFDDHSNYYIKIPDTFDKVYGYTDILNDVVSPVRANPHYYLVHLEGEQYYFNDYDYNLGLNIYNLNKERINLGYFFNTSQIYKHYSTFTTPEGDYYFEISNNVSNYDYKFVLTKLNYNDIYDFNNPITIIEGSFSYEIEGTYDLIIANYISDKKGVIYFTNNSDKSASVYYNDYMTSGFANETIQDGKLFIVQPGNNYFYLYGQKGNYDYTIHFMYLDRYKDKIETIDILENDINDWLVTGPKLDKSYFKLNILNKGVISFNSTKFNDYSDTPQIGIYDINTNQLIKSIYINNDKVILEQGNYYIGVTSYRVGIYKLACEYEPLINDVEEITLDKYNGTDIWSNDFPNYTGVSYTNDQEFIYGKKFTLTETSNVLISCFDYFTIYNSENIKMNVTEVSNRHGGTIFNLETGTYLVQIKTIYDYYKSYDLKIAILTTIIEDDIPYNIQNATLARIGINTVVLNYSYDVDILKFVISEDGTYIIDNNFTDFSLSISIHDENLNYYYLLYSNSLKELKFTRGTYYFIIYSNNSESEARFSINKIS